jgi:8-oxo-dGDP phosphatase
MIILGPDELTDVQLSWPVESSTVLAEGRITKYVQDQVITPSGHVITREYLKHPGAVGVIALDDHERVALVRQYRHPVRHRLIEPPAGLLDVGGEDYLPAMQRELAEEVGLAAGNWAVLVDLFTTPGILGESLRIYLARDLQAVDGPDDYIREGEEAHMDVVWAFLDDLAEAVLDGRLHNPTVVSGVLAAWTARQRDGFASLRAANAAWPALDSVRKASPLKETGHEQQS